MSEASSVNWWDVVERIWNEQETSENPEVFLNWFRGLTDMQRVLFPTHWLCAEVYNGGFHQYFSNLTGMHAPEAAAGFRRLGLIDVAETVEKAMAVFGSEFPRDRESRERFLDSIEGKEISEWNPFFELDDVFYDLIKIRREPALSDDDRFTVAAAEFVNRSF